MNTPNGSKTQNDLDRVLEKIAEIAKASAKGDHIYIYRGESKCYSKVCSGLYREYETGIKGTYFNIGVIQTEIVREAKEYTDKTDEFEILTEIQHYGGNTNLIDFTTDYLVALFFACDGEHEEPGRVILLRKPTKVVPKDYIVKKPPRTIRRAEVQKSIFVQARRGFVEPNVFVYIPRDLKIPMLGYLEKYHDISTKTIYNDLLGFIEKRRIHKKWHAEFYIGLSYQMRGDSEKDPRKKRRAYDKAIEHYTTAIEVNPDYANAYNNRSIIYRLKGNFDAVIQDCNKAIELNPDFAPAYLNRGNAYAEKGNVDEAIKNYTTAIEVNPNYVNAYNNRGTAYRRAGKFDEAIKDHTTAIELDRENAESYDNRGTDYYRKKRFDRAIEDYSTAIELNPKFANAYNNRGTAYHQKGNLDSAIEDYSTAIELNPYFTSAYSHRGEALLHLKKWEKAKTDLSKAKGMGHDIVDSFHKDYESVEDFEARNGVRIPTDIAALLQRTNPSSRKAKYKSYTQLLIDELREKHNFTRARVGQPDNWYEFSAGIRGIRYGIQFKRGNKVLTCIKIYEDIQSNRLDLFDALAERKEQIESAFGSPLEWERLEEQQRSRIVVPRDGNIELPDDALEEIRKWHIANLLKFKAVFLPEIKNALETLT